MASAHSVAKLNRRHIKPGAFCSVLQMLPLLWREIRVDRLVVDGTNALLETDKNGRGNCYVGNIYKLLHSILTDRRTLRTRSTRERSAEHRLDFTPNYLPLKELPYGMLMLLARSRMVGAPDREGQHVHKAHP